MEIIKTDILVIGTGTAGLAAGVYAAASGQEVLAIDKGASGKSGSSVGAVQIASRGEWSLPEDSKDAYLRDILESGRGLSDPALTNILVDEISGRIEDLLGWGLKLDQTEQKNIAVSATSGHSIPRSVSSKKGKAGLGILQALKKKAKGCTNLKTWSDVITLELIKSDGRVSGAVVLDLTDNQAYIIQSRVVILATGGAGQLYPVTSNPVQATGDGFALSLEAGAELVDMEQVQFYPVSLLEPRPLSGLCLSFYHMSKLFNNQGGRFMENYEPDTMENTTRDKLAIAIATEVAEGRGTPHNGVWLDASSRTEEIKESFLHEYQLCQDHGLDLARKKAETGPAAHFFMGGVRMDTNAASSVPGLFIAGEAAGGLHGGNRLGNNALTECLVFGARAGQSAAEEAKSHTSFPSVEKLEMNKAEQMLTALASSNHGTVRSFVCKEEVQAVMGQLVGVARSTDSLLQARTQLLHVETKLQKVNITTFSHPYSREVIDYIEAVHMVQTARAVTEAALAREESRGAHYNTDFPDPSAVVNHTLVSMIDGELEGKLVPGKGGA